MCAVRSTLRNSLPLAALLLVAGCSQVFVDVPSAETQQPEVFAIAGAVNGLFGEGLELADGAGNSLVVTQGGPFAFPSGAPAGRRISVTVEKQPSGPEQICTVSAAGQVESVADDVTDIAVACATKRFSIGGTVTGLAGVGLVLQDQLAEQLSISTDGPFAFPEGALSGSHYSVAVLDQPTAPSQICTVTGESGPVVDADITSVAITCVTDSYFVGGVVSGLVGAGLVLHSDAQGDLEIESDGPFAFPIPLAWGTPFTVTVAAQPSAPAQSCKVLGGHGVVAGADVTTVYVNCALDAFVVGGTVSGLEGTGLVLQNGQGVDLPVSQNGAFAFATAVASGEEYSIAVSQQPSSPSQTCTVENGEGTIGDDDVSSVLVSCSPGSYAIGGKVIGLSGTVVLQNNQVDELTLSANGSFVFADSLLDGQAYSVTVKTQPSSQQCTVAKESGVVEHSPVMLLVHCEGEKYTIGGTVTGLEGTGLVLQNLGADDQAIAEDGPFSFEQALPSGSEYHVMVATQPSDPAQVCTVVNGEGTVGTGPVTTVAVSCSTGPPPSDNLDS